jgi:hypothetical protein
LPFYGGALTDRIFMRYQQINFWAWGRWERSRA